MPNYRRAKVPGGTFFLTIVTHLRKPIFADPANVDRLRRALIEVRKDQPIDVVAAVVLPDHFHFVWSLPPGDGDFSKRLGRMKVLFTRSMQGQLAPSRRPRESLLWQQRFWEHPIEDEADLEAHLNYIHFNPLKHGLTTCPHFWPHSSFHRWVARGLYPKDWGCSCPGRSTPLPRIADLGDRAGE